MGKGSSAAAWCLVPALLVAGLLAMTLQASISSAANGGISRSLPATRWVTGAVTSTLFLPLVRNSIPLLGGGSGPVRITAQADGLGCAVAGETTGYTFKWYRNGVILAGETAPQLTINAMATYKGVSTEYTPLSQHTGHSFRGYQFLCEGFNGNGTPLGADSVTVDGPRSTEAIRGILVSYFDNQWALASTTDHTLSRLLNTGLNWVSLDTFHYQDGLDGTVIYARTSGFPNTISDDRLAYLISRAHQLGLKVNLYPEIWLALPDGSATAADRANIVGSDGWFAAYKEFILGRATLAEQTGVDLLTIGVELMASASRADKWLDIITSVRARYRGPITFSAIACCQYGIERLRDYPWFSQLDYVGLSANLETRSGNTDPTLNGLALFYQQLATEMKEVHDKFGKPVVLTESIMPSNDGATISPRDWNWSVPDFQEQADYYDAFFQTFSGNSWVNGMFVGVWVPGRETDYQLDPGWAPGIFFLNKPAERVITSWYGGVYSGP